MRIRSSTAFEGKGVRLREAARTVARRRDGPRARWRFALAALVLAGILLHSPGVQHHVAAQAAVGMTRSAAHERIDALLGALGDLRSRLDRAAFDVDALALALAFEEPEAIVDWVRTNIRFEPYAGVLRGPEGTLQSGAGNALDQSVLLARLLNDVGFEANVHVGRIGREEAARLVQTVGLFGTTPSVGDRDATLDAADIVARLAEISGLDLRSAEFVLDEALSGSDPLRIPEFEEARLETARLLDVMAEERIDLRTDSLALQETERHVEIAQAYAWVEYREVPTAPWRRAHPAFLDVPDGLDGVVSERTMMGSIEEDLLHRVRFEAFIDRRRGDTVETVPIIAPFERPAAALNGQLITFSVLPNTFVSAHEGSAFDEGIAFSAAEAEMFFPIMNGRSPDGATGFDLMGNTFPVEVMNTVAAELFQSVGSSFNQAASALGGLGRSDAEESPSPMAQLERVWIEYTVIEPGGVETSQARTVFPRPRPDGGPVDAAHMLTEHPARAIADISTSQAFMVASGRFHAEYVLDREVAALVSHREALLGVVDLLLGVATDGVPSASADQLGANDLAETRVLRLFQFFDAGADAIGYAYRPVPSIVAFESGLRVGQHETVGFASVDIVSNRRSVVVGDEAGVRVDPASAVAVGVWETFAEGAGSPVGVGAAIEYYETARVLAGESDGSPRATVWSSSSLDRLSAAFRAPDVRAAAVQDVERGLVLVGPANVPPDAGLSAWWRVDPETGTTLGVTSDGRGLQFLEYIVLFAFGFSVALVACMIIMWLLYAPSVRLVRFDPETGAGVESTFRAHERHNDQVPSQARTCLSIGLGAGSLLTPVKKVGIVAFALAALNDIDNAAP